MDDPLYANLQYGLELALTTHSKIIKSREDLVVVWLHWCFVKNGFKNHGGEFTHRDYSSENLPYNLGWNGDKGAYILKYRLESVPYVVALFLDNDSQLVLSLVSLDKSFRISIMTKDLVDDALQLIPKSLENLTSVVDSEILIPAVALGSSKTILDIMGEPVANDANDQQFPDLNAVEDQLVG